MRPIELTMNAFGPFKEKVTLDFTRFEQQNTFLVSGPTGSGKTTIFDAISYVLYGEASGTMREVDGLKSTHATDEDLCYVHFTFEVRGEVYTIQRAPTQRAPGKTGKPINYQSTVHMEYGDDKVLSKVSEVEDKINSVLGMNADQFHQIVLLPQGEFRKMLDSSSKEKTEIFRDIFKTHPLENFQEKLKENKKEIEKDYESNEKLVDQVLNRIEAEPYEELREAVSRKDLPKVQKELEFALNQEKDQEREKEEALQSLAGRVKEHEALIRDLTEKDQLEKEAAELKEKEADIREREAALSRNETAEKLQEEEQRYQDALHSEKDSKNRLAKSKEALDETMKELQASQATYEKVQKEYDKLPVYREELSKTEEELRNKINIEETEAECDQLQREHTKQAELKENLENNIEINEEKEKEILAEEKKLKALEKDKEIKNKIYSKEEKRFAKLKERLKQFDKWKQVVEEHKVAIEEYQEKEEAYREENEAYDRLFTQYKRNAAGILASDLQKNKACPVCGSCDHPQIAVLSDHDVSEEAVRKQEEKRQAASQAFSAVGSAMEQKQKAIIAFSVELEVAESDREAEYEKTKMDCEESEQNLAYLQEEIEHLSEELSKKDEIASKKEAYHDEKSKLKVEIAEASTIMKENKKKLDTLEGRLTELEEKTGTVSKRELEEKFEEIKEKIEIIERDYKKEGEQHQQLVTTRASLESAVQGGQEDVERHTELLSDRKRAFEKMLAESSLESDYVKHLLDTDRVSSFEEEINEYNSKKIINENSLDKIEKALETRDHLQEREAYEQELETLQERKELLSEEKQKNAIRLDQYETSAKELKELSERGNDLQEKYGRYEELARLANGSSKVTDYISFERYVLGIYFDDILRAANLRFERMSNHRYQLRRKKEAGKGAGAKGLDLEVMDQQTGTRRDVSTLSGGESFEASLSLAMGMSDVLQSQQGGVSVDTLFIDEGFGTLDSEALDNAIEILMDLNGEGRLIGIISHVEELKIRIPSQIEVKKENEGSSARIIT